MAMCVEDCHLMIIAQAKRALQHPWKDVIRV